MIMESIKLRRNLAIQAYVYFREQSNVTNSFFEVTAMREALIRYINHLKTLEPKHVNVDVSSEWYLPPAGVTDFKLWVSCLHIGFPANTFVHYLDRFCCSFSDNLPRGKNVIIKPGNWCIGTGSGCPQVSLTWAVPTERIRPMRLSVASEMHYKGKVLLRKLIPTKTTIALIGAAAVGAWVLLKPILSTVVPPIPGIFQGKKGSKQPKGRDAWGYDDPVTGNFSRARKAGRVHKEGREFERRYDEDRHEGPRYIPTRKQDYHDGQWRDNRRRPVKGDPEFQSYQARSSDVSLLNNCWTVE